MKKSLLFLIVVAVLVSCSEYNKVLKSDDYEQKFKVANEKFDAKKWSQSIALYEQVYQRQPKSSEGEVAYFRLGKAYYAAGDYYMAGYYFGSFFDKYPYSAKTEEAFFLKALCSVNNSPEFSLDQQETEIALNDVQQFIYLYPRSTKIDTCNQIMDKLRAKLEFKEYSNVKLYAKTSNFRAATTSAETFIATYPASKYKEEVYFIEIENAFMLAKNSIDEKKKERIEKTIETYRNFVALFPQSEYLVKAQVYFDEMQKMLNSTTN